MAAELIRVKLPVCLRCGHVGKRPVFGDVTGYCTGAVGELHKKTRMVTVIFTGEPPRDRSGEGLIEAACPRCHGLTWREPGPGKPPLCDACRSGG